MSDLFREFWWLMMPVLWMVIAIVHTGNADKRAAQARELVQAYVAQGKEPPAELVALAAKT